ncbi:MAG: 30S ribosomal protein S20 [Candidatus Nealsonbacteria bacterium]
MIILLYAYIFFYQDLYKKYIICYANFIMPIKESAKKALRQSIKRKERNLVYKKKMKELIKEIRSLVLEKKAEEARKLLSQAYKIIDKSAKVNIIKKNTASRKKSRLTKLIKNSQ